jgi:hypothetical protein
MLDPVHEAAHPEVQSQGNYRSKHQQDERKQQKDD